MVAFLISALKIIFVLSFLVLIHEGGHFLVAKFFKVKVNEFSIGFGKSLVSKQKGETKYSIRMIPLGGYVSMLGEEERVDDERSFSKQSIPKRIAIVAAGGLVNIVFGLIVYFVVIACMGNFVSKNVDYVLEDYGAEQAGIVSGDEIVKINNKHVFVSQDVNTELAKSGSKEVTLKVKRDGEIKEFKVTPTEIKGKTLGIYLDSENSTKIAYISDDSSVKDTLQLGDIIVKINDEYVKDDYEKMIAAVDSAEDTIDLTIERNGDLQQFAVTPKEYSNYYVGIVFKQAEKDFFTRIYYAWFETGNFAISLIDNVKSLFTGGISVNQMMGPIGISKTVSSTKTLYDYIYLLALISLSLGITNLLPFPALDGGKILILLIEAIRRKPLKENTEIAIQMLGFGLLILLSIYVSYFDVMRFL